MKILGIGVDIVSNKRIARILTQRYSERFLSRVLSQHGQLDQFRMRKSLEEQTRYLASRWAYKQATVKATGNKQLVFAQMHLQKQPSGKPRIIFESQNKTLVEAMGLAQAYVSVSHEQDYSVAFVLATLK